MPHFTTRSGTRIPELELTPQLFLDRTAVLNGPSGTGKTVIVKSIMKTLNGYIDQILVISPTESSNRSYEGYVPQPLIHYNLSLPDPKDKKDTPAKSAMRFLKSVWDRQEMMAAIYTRANEATILASLYKRLHKRERIDGDQNLASLERKRLRCIKSIKRNTKGNLGAQDEKIKKISMKFEGMLKLIYKKYINSGYKIIWKKKDLSTDERYSLWYLNFNPHLLLIFDDCAAQLKPFFKKEIFRKLFYQNRHSFITVIVCCQDDTDLPTNLRKNAFITIFTEKIVCTSNFGRASNNFPKQVKTFVNENVPEVFVGYRKLAYIREDSKNQNFYHITCKYPRTFKFGSQALWELCDAVRSKEVSMDTKNPYYERFKVI